MVLMKSIHIKKRIRPILFFCLAALSPSLSFAQDIASTESHSADSVTIHSAGKPNLLHGGIQQSGNKLTQPHITFDEVKQKADLTAASQPLLSDPDFVFPQTVEKNAAKIYDEALKANQPVTALRAAIQLNIAENQITNDSVSAALERYQYLSEKLQTPYSALAALLEARLLLEVYSSEPYVYDNRTLPEDTLESNPLLWDGKRFKRRITALIEMVLRQRDALSMTPISAIAPLLENSKEAEKAGLTALDFATYRIIDLLKRIQNSDVQVDTDAIPFESDSTSALPTPKSEKRLTAIDVIDNLINYYCQSGELGSEALLRARLSKFRILNESQKNEYADNLLEIYGPTDKWRPLVVNQVINYVFSNSDSQQQTEIKHTELLKQTIKDFPKSEYTPCLVNKLEVKSRPFVSIHVPGQAIPFKATTASYEIQNLKDCYILLIPVNPPKVNDAYEQRQLAAKGEVKVITHITHDAEQPWQLSGEMEIPGLSPGYYAIVPSSTPKMSGFFDAFNRYTVPIINVCEFNLLTAYGSKANNDKNFKDQRIYVSDASTGKPIKGAKYQCKNNERQSRGMTQSISGITDENGFFQCPFESFDCLVTYNGSSMENRMWSYQTANRESVTYSASILTDLALYHPGDSINLVTVVSKCASNITSPAPDKPVSIALLDVNHKNVATVECTTDKYGRATAEFSIPRDKMTGVYTLTLTLGDEAESNKSLIATSSVEVAEYKAPTFRVLLDSPVLSDDTLEITGSVLTYSGMPLSDVDVNISINFIMSWWRRYYTANLPSNYNVEAITNQAGRFSVKLGINPLLGTPYEAGWFKVSATATSDAGETESSNSQSFTITQGFHTELEEATIEVTGESLSIPVKVTDVIGKPVVKELSYEITDGKGAVIKNGKFKSPNLTLASSLIKSGKYKLRTILEDAMKEYAGVDKGIWKADTAECNIIIWRPSDVKPPYSTPLWIPETKVYASSNSNKVNVKAGSGFSDSYLFYQVSDCDSIIKEGWIKASDRNIELPVNAPREGNRLKIYFRGMHNLQEAVGSVIVLPAIDNQKLQLTVETFRNRIDPTSKEQWRFLFSCDGQPIPAAPAMAVLSDASLNSITPFRWSMDNRRTLRYPTLGEVRNYSLGYDGMGGYIKNVKSIGECDRFIYPNWQLWHYNLYDGSDMVVIAYGSVKRSALTGSMAAVESNGVRNLMSRKMEYADAADEVMVESAMEMADMEMESEDGGLKESQLEDIPLRDTEHPLAFFKPLLLTGNDGLIDITFDVPDFNTTWAFQLLAYDDKLRSAYISEEIVAAKPVMVSTNMPRFLLTGDKASVATTMFNNSDTPLVLNGRIEVIDPTTRKVIAFSDSGDMPTDPSANATFSAEFKVPNDCNSLILRSVVRSERGSDGEQDMVQVLPSSQPVMDATTFYLTPEEKELNVKLPKMGSGDMVTLNYCANPAWYVLTSLSGFIKPDTESTLTNLNALYANCIAVGLISHYPNLRKGLEIIFEGDKSNSGVTTSPLDQNDELKISTLQNTPWVNNAESETRRMHSLNTLIKPEEGQEAINVIIDQIRKNQTSEGGFKWMPQMKNDDLWITLNVLDCAARIKESGFSPKDTQFETMIVKALKYTDLKVGNNYHETVHKNKSRYSLISEMDYLLTRSILTNKPASGLIDEMRRDMLKRLPKEWKDLSIANKTVAARILKREGNIKLAREIMESVKQFASYKPDKGMWFDKLRDDWFSPSPKMVTALVIHALNEVLPEDDAIMKMCQYLVLSRQTEDWNLDMSPAAVTMTANALLSSNLGWTAPDADLPPTITLNGRALDLNDAQALTGNIYIDLSPQEASGATLSVSCNASTPAWGGVLRQYVAPIRNIKAHSVPQLKVTKRLLPIETATGGEKAHAASTSFHKGDLIRVTLTLETDRDLDYVLINDRRGAFMQPAEQLTTYTVENGLWLLRETRNTATNFYLTRLPKGEYILTYDVYADRDGEYSTGIATAQSQYYPMITAHSAGCLVTVE